MMGKAVNRFARQNFDRAFFLNDRCQIAYKRGEQFSIAHMPFKTTPISIESAKVFRHVDVNIPWSKGEQLFELFAVVTVCSKT